MTATTQNLERRAIAAHRDGVGWDAFWAEHAAEVREAEPFNVQRFHRLHGRLLHLLSTGEASGQFGVGDPDAAPWAAGDVPVDVYGQPVQLSLLDAPGRADG